MNKIRFKECKILITFFSIVMILYYLKIPIPCIFHKITHLYCPGCGVTRMMNALFHFQFEEAFSYNALVFILILLFFIYAIVNIGSYAIFKKTIKVPKYFSYILIFLTILFGIMRNISIFSYLAP